MYPMFKFDGNLTDPETGTDQFVRIDVEIPADTNYPPGTQLMNLHDYKMIMPIGSGLVSRLSQDRGYITILHPNISKTSDIETKKAKTIHFISMRLQLD